MMRKLNQLPTYPKTLLSTGARGRRKKLVFRFFLSMGTYPAMIMLSIVAAALVIFVFPDIILRPILIIWFIFICPGMTVVRFFMLNDAVMEWLLALALSIAIDAFIAGILLYAGWWSPIHISIVLMSFCLIGIMILLIVTYSGFIRQKGEKIVPIP